MRQRLIRDTLRQAAVDRGDVGRVQAHRVGEGLLGQPGGEARVVRTRSPKTTGGGRRRAGMPRVVLFASYGSRDNESSLPAAVGSGEEEPDVRASQQRSTRQPVHHDCAAGRDPGEATALAMDRARGRRSAGDRGGSSGVRPARSHRMPVRPALFASVPSIPSTLVPSTSTPPTTVAVPDTTVPVQVAAPTAVQVANALMAAGIPISYPITDTTHAAQTGTATADYERTRLLTEASTANDMYDVTVYVFTSPSARQEVEAFWAAKSGCPGTPC